MEKKVTLPRIESGRSNYDSIENVNRLDKFESAYKSVNIANFKIKARLDKLKKESERLKGIGNNLVPFNREKGRFFNLRNFAGNKSYFMNPNLYANQFIDPIYYPLEMPINAEPISLPKIELGMPLSEYDDSSNNSRGGLGLADLIALMQASKNIDNENDDDSDELNNIPMKEEDKKVKKKPKLPIKSPAKTKRNWWKITKSFINIYKFFKLAEKYGKHSNVRNPVVTEMTNSVLPHLESIKSWVISCMNSFVREMQIFPDLNLQFHNHSGKLTIQAQSQKIMAILKILIIEIAKRSSSINDVPLKIQELIYKYIREKAYYPRKFLTSFIVNRLDFNFYGATKNLSDDQVGMLVSFLIISKTIVQQILLYPKENFEQFHNFRYIDVTCKMLGSILHYLGRDAFISSPPMVKELLALLNYYRNYHIFNEQIEKQQDIFSNNMVFRDQDEIARDLVAENSITEFFNMNARWCSQMKSLILKWGSNLARQIKNKFSKLDRNLEKKQINKPLIDQKMEDI